LDALVALDSACRVCVARELTKHFEEFRRGPVSEIREHYAAHAPRGEITLVIAESEKTVGRGSGTEDANSQGD
jgi:16S rRNA (cytidine1402-2'-O)-methyltransferase